MKRNLIIAVIWILCGCANWGLTLGYFTHRFPYGQHTPFAAAVALCGPLALPAVVIDSSPNYYFLWKPKTTEERWQEFQKEGFGDLGREYFERMEN